MQTLRLAASAARPSEPGCRDGASVKARRVQMCTAGHPERRYNDERSHQRVEKRPAKGLAELTTLRDEVRVKLHLAGMDLKDQWNKLEPRVADVEKKAAAEVSEVSRAALTDVIKKLIKLRAAI